MRDPVAARGQRLDLDRCLLFDPDSDHFESGFTCRLQGEHREATIAGDKSVDHLMNPRLEARMKSSSSPTSGDAPTSAAIRSTACVVLRPERVSTRNALCRASMVSAAKPRRLRPTAFSPYTFASR